MATNSSALRPALTACIFVLLGSAAPARAEPAPSASKGRDAPAVAPEDPTAYEQRAAAPEPSTSTAPTAASQGSEQSQEQRMVRARALFEQGRSLAAEAEYEQACQAFEESLALEQRPSTEFNLADCWERLGKTATAHNLYVKVAKAMQDSGDSGRAAVALRRAELLNYRLCGVAIETSTLPKGFVLELDGRSIPLEQLTEPIAVDPGEHKLVASAPGKRKWAAVVDADSCPSLETVEVPPLSEAGAPPPKTVAAKVPQPEPEPTSKQQPAAAKSSQSLVWPITLGSVGAGALVVGIVTALQAQDKNEEAKSICPTSVNCSPDEIERHASLVDSAKTFSTVAYVGFGVSAAALGSAVAVYFLQKPKDARGDHGSWRLTPVTAMGINGWGASVSGEF